MNKAIFTFAGYNFDLDKGEASFRYAFSGEENLEFIDKIFFPPVKSEIPEPLLKSLFNSLSLILGVSYWKMFCPKDIEIKSVVLSKKQAEFWDIVYTKGLGEFFYNNKLDFRGLVNFPFDESVNPQPVSYSRQNRSLVGIGGGKDSIVTAELLKKKSEKFDLLAIGDHPFQLEVSRLIGKDPIIIKRKFDPKLFELKESGRVYIGHIPLSAIYAFLGVMAAAFYDYESFIVSNEKSANYGNVDYLGEEINHQWSKSEEFENLFKDYVSKFISPDINYYSFLRKYNEFEITELFSKHKKYFKTFSSCNRSYGTDPQGYLNVSDRWCGKCPKCLFVFIMLSAFISKEQLLEIFGKNLFEDKNLLSLFEELLGVKRFKPFECVGTPEEVRKALDLASKKSELKGHFLMDYYERL